MAEAVAVADAFLDAYNVGNDAALLALCAEDIEVVHHNRGLAITGRDAFEHALGIVGLLFPDKRFGNRRGAHQDGDTAVITHTWTGTAEAPVPGLASQIGEVARVDLCSIYTVRDGLIVSYHDYG
jgi:ketosteroid isomerase-like protein